MNARPGIDMVKATRLTREGRLGEAMEVLRGTPPQASPHSTVLDMVPPSRETGASWTSQEAAQARGTEHHRDGTPRAVPEPLRRFLDRMGRRRHVDERDDPVASAKPGAAAPLPEGALFDERSFANEAGSRAYKLYVPSGYSERALPLVVMLHGCSQSPDDFAAGTRMNHLAEEQTFIVAYPAQPRSANASKCWNWFNAGDQQRDRGEPSLIAGITRQIMLDFRIQSARVYIAGLSAGGAKAAIMGAAYPDLYAAIGVHSGLACGAAHDLPSALNAMRRGGLATGSGQSLRGRSGDPMPAIVFHGDGDTTVNPVNADQVIAQSKAAAALEAAVVHGTTAGGARYTRTVHSDELGRPMLEQWVLHGAGHAWSGGSPEGSYTEPRGPDASREMVRFFLQHTRPMPF